MARLDPSETWSAERCNDRHTSIGWVLKSVVAVMSVLCVVVGWMVVATARASSEAAAAARAAEVQAAKNDEYRVYVKQDMADLKMALRALVEKQERMNESLQRLLQRAENKP